VKAKIHIVVISLILGWLSTSACKVSRYGFTKQDNNKENTDQTDDNKEKTRDLTIKTNPSNGEVGESISFSAECAVTEDVDRIEWELSFRDERVTGFQFEEVFRQVGTYQVKAICYFKDGQELVRTLDYQIIAEGSRGTIIDWGTDPSQICAPNSQICTDPSQIIVPTDPSQIVIVPSPGKI
jgi:hypothetical protein